MKIQGNLLAIAGAAAGALLGASSAKAQSPTPVGGNTQQQIDMLHHQIKTNEVSLQLLRGSLYNPGNNLELDTEYKIITAGKALGDNAAAQGGVYPKDLTAPGNAAVNQLTDDATGQPFSYIQTENGGAFTLFDPDPNPANYGLPVLSFSSKAGLIDGTNSFDEVNYMRQDAEQKLLFLADKVILYAHNTGNYPNSLDELSPSYLPKLPVDIATGENFNYQVGPGMFSISVPDPSQYNLKTLSCNSIPDSIAPQLLEEGTPANAEDNMMPVVAALQTYAMNNGGMYPGSLNELVPPYLPEMPLDKATAQPFVYINLDGTYRLSVPNAEDYGKENLFYDSTIGFQENGIPKSTDTLSRASAEIRMKELAAFLEAYKRDHGVYPGNLNALDQRYTRTARYPDPASNQPFIYTPINNGQAFLLKPPNPQLYDSNFSYSSSGGLQTPQSAGSAFFTNASAQSQLMMTGAALELYKRDHGKYPEQLESLMPVYLISVPKDPVSNTAMAYQSTGTSYTLSVASPHEYPQFYNTYAKSNPLTDPVFPPPLGASPDLVEPLGRLYYTPEQGLQINGKFDNFLQGSDFMHQVAQGTLADFIPPVLNLYRIEHGEYPDTLQTLVPDYVREIPVDLLTGRPYVYQADGKSFRVDVPQPQAYGDTEFYVSSDKGLKETGPLAIVPDYITQQAVSALSNVGLSVLAYAMSNHGQYPSDLKQLGTLLPNDPATEQPLRYSTFNNGNDFVVRVPYPTVYGKSRFDFSSSQGLVDRDSTAADVVFAKGKSTMTHIGLGLEQYYNSYGFYPKKLNDIINGLIPVVPLDPASQQPYRYEVSGNSYTLSAPDPGAYGLTTLSFSPQGLLEGHNNGRVNPGRSKTKNRTHASQSIEN